MIPVYEAIAEELSRQGVTVAFGLVSEETAKLIVELQRHGIAYHSTRHEAIAVGMADGYARSSEQVGIAVVGRGPGLTNALSPLVSAAKGHAKIVVLIGDSDAGVADPARATAVLREEKYIDQGALLAAAGVPHVTLRSPQSATATMAELCDRARAGLTIAVNLPGDLLEAEAGDASADTDLPTPPAPVPHADESALAAVADLIQETWAVRRPVVLAGRGAVNSKAKEDLVALADRCGALLATTLMGRSMFAGHPYDLGVAGTFSNEPAIELLAEADLVLAFGASLNEFTTLRGKLFPKATVVQFDANPSAIGMHLQVDLGVAGDARSSAAALTAELIRRGHESSGYRKAEVAAKIADFRVENTISDCGRPGALDPRMVMLELDRILPKERAVVVDSGNNWIFASAYLSVPQPEAYISRLEYYCVGSGLGPALGTAVARPDRLTVLAVGDGGLMMTLADLDTAVRLRLPLVVVVSNDGAFGSDVHFLQWCGFPDDIARVPAASFEGLARGFGADGLTVNTLEDIMQLRGRLDELEGPFIVDCRVTAELRPEATDWFLAGRYPVEPVATHDA
jgi:thiamine pyrophosphate-dependent acetolactate synthase large subunit-like protein